MGRGEAAKIRSDAAAKFLRRHRQFQFAFWAFIALLIATIAADHVGIFGPLHDDWSRFNHRTFTVTNVVSGDTIRIRSMDRRSNETIKLLGVSAPQPGEPWATQSQTYAADRLLNHPVTLLLEPPGTRDKNGQLLAYVFLLDIDDFNVDCVHDGMARADHQQPAMFRPMIDMAQTDARKKSRGLWKKTVDSELLYEER